MEEVSRGTRFSEQQLLGEIISTFNKNEELKHLKLPSDEIKALKFLGARSTVFIDRLTLMWGQEQPANTAIPMNLLAEDWLQDSMSLPVY
jgi:hypothetical protein